MTKPNLLAKMRILVELEQSEDSLNAGPAPLPTLACIFCKCVLSFIDGDPTKFFIHLRDNHSIQFNHSLALYINLLDQNKIDEFVNDSFKFVKNRNDANLGLTKPHNITVESKDDGYDDEEVVSENESACKGTTKEKEDKIDDTVSFLINEKVVSESASKGNAKENENKTDDTVSFLVNEEIANFESFFTNKKYNDISILSTLSAMSIEDSTKSMGKKFEKQQKIKRRLSFKTCLNDEEFYGPGNRNFFSLRNRLGLKSSRSKNKAPKAAQKIGINNNIIKPSDESKLQNDNKFTCNLCGKRFAAKGSLNVHMKTHTEGLPIGTRAGKLEEQMNALQRRLSMLNKK